MNLPILDKRLSAISKEISQNARVADIGTDHGYLIAYLAAKGILTKGYACDVNENPLKSAYTTLSKYNVCDKVECVLSNGLDKLNSSDIDEIIIAGMGGDLILRILTSSNWDFTGKKLILQPMTKADNLRIGLLNNGFRIVSETPVSEGKFIYTIISAEYVGIKKECDMFYAFVGEIINSTSFEKKYYLQRIYNNLSRRIEGLKNTSDNSKSNEYLDIIKKLEKIIKENPNL